MNISENVLSHIAPIRWVLYAYGLSGIDASLSGALAGLLGISNPPEDAAAAWKLYTEELEIQETREDGAFYPFRRLCEIFNLTSFSRFAATLALASDTAPEFHTAFSALGGLTPLLAFKLFSASAVEAIGLQADWLQNEHSLRSVFISTDFYEPLRLRPVALNFLLGVSSPPEPYELFIPSDSLAEPLIECDIPKRVADRLKNHPFGNLFLLYGAKGSGRTYQMERFAEEYQVPILKIRYDDIPNDAENRRSLFSFPALNSCFICIYALPENEIPSKIVDLLRSVYPVNLFVHITEEMPFNTENYTVIPLAVRIPAQNERLGIWRLRLGDLLPLELSELLSARYCFTIGQILSACETLLAQSASEGAENINSEAVHAACRRQLTHGLGKLAVRVKGGFGWDDLILPPLQKQMLEHICDRVRHGPTVYDVWGLDAKAAYGHGMHALFSGSPGTGKTMAAQIIAGDLGMELFKIDLSSLVSKYIGETEKNIDNVFAEATKSSGLLFFDEADAIFGRRGEQKDSHDKYANLQTAFLLQRFEDYDGVVLLATNLISNLDPAFMRRIQVRVDFPAPDRELRRQLWEKQLTGNGEVPLSGDIDIPFLSEAFELTGAAIKNIVMTAAFLSAAKGVAVGMQEIVRAMMMEYSKSDKILSGRELGEYAYHLEK